MAVLMRLAMLNPNMSWRFDAAILTLINLWFIPLLIFPHWFFSKPQVFHFFLSGAQTTHPLWFDPLIFLMIFANIWMSLRLNFRHPFYLMAAALMFQNGFYQAATTQLRLYAGPEYNQPLGYNQTAGSGFPYDFILW